MTSTERLERMRWASGWSARITDYMRRIPLDDPQRVEKIVRACTLGRHMVDKYIINAREWEAGVTPEPEPHRTYYVAGARAAFEILRDWLIIVVCLRYLGF